MLEIGSILPDAILRSMGAEGPEQFQLRDILAGRRVVLFGLPGAFTPTCSAAHVPSFVRTAEKFRAAGIDDIICVAVNDIHVMGLWGQETGGIGAGIKFLADCDGAFTAAIGMAFDAPAVGFHGRSKRYSMLAENGVVKIFNPEIARGVCEISAGETLLAQI